MLVANWLIHVFYHKIYYSRVLNKSTGTMKKTEQKFKQYAIFFAVLLKVIQDFGLWYSYSILPIVPQSYKIGNLNWYKAAR